eukprot:scaffold460359_cov46-Prasinocladus_malaysianus.AAC.1
MPRRNSKRHSGYAFEDPCHEGYHAKKARESLEPKLRESATAAVLKAHSESFNRNSAVAVAAPAKGSSMKKQGGARKQLKVVFHG